MKSEGEWALSAMLKDYFLVCWWFDSEDGEELLSVTVRRLIMQQDVEIQT
jgi:hypothetical protein